MGDGRSLDDLPSRFESAAAEMRVRVCLPDSAARVCEPYGELWKQIGATIGGSCVTFDLLRIGRWWSQLRARPALVLSPDDPNLVGLFKRKPYSKRKASSSSTSYAKAVRKRREDEYREWLSSPSTRAAHEALLRHAHGARRCAFVGSGHDLRCGAPRGREIDSAFDLVFRANAAQLHGAPVAAGNVPPVAHSDIAGSRTDIRVNGMVRSRVWDGRTTKMQLISRAWFKQPWGDEAFNNAHRLCCLKADAVSAQRSRYHIRHIRHLVCS